MAGEITVININMFILMCFFYYMIILNNVMYNVMDAMYHSTFIKKNILLALSCGIKVMKQLGTCVTAD